MAAMNEANADYVYPIIALGLRVKERLLRGHPLDQPAPRDQSI